MPQTRHALIINGEVAEERMHDPSIPVKVRDGKPVLRPIQEVTTEYNPDTQTYTISREIQNNKVVDTWIVVDLSQEVRDAKLLTALAAHRYLKETGGITISDIPIQTDRDTRANLIAARTLAKEDSGYTVKWKTPGGFVTLDAATIIAVADAVASHVQACFEAEATITANVAEYDSIAEVTAAFDALMEAEE